MGWGGRLLPVVVAAAMTGGCGGGTRERHAVMDALRNALDRPASPAFVTTDAEGRTLWRVTRAFYERRGFAPAWLDGNDPAPHMADLIKALHAAREEGLDPALYNVGLLERRYQKASSGFLTREGFDPAEAGALDAWLTYLYLRYASDLADGLSDLASADSTWRIRREKFDPAAHLTNALETKGVAGSLAALTPSHPQYVALRRALADYRAQAARGPWPTLPRTLKLKPGQRSPHVPALAARLAASGDYGGPVPPSGQDAVYGSALQEAVAQFGRRHGLADTGVVGGELVAQLNVPLNRRIGEIQLNLERWRWLPRNLGERHILVNIPEYHLEVWERGRVPLAMRVVVGKGDTPTPIFNDQMTYLVFSPYWNVPPDIAQGETLPELLKDPGFLQRTNMEVLDKAGAVVDPAAIDLLDPTQYRFRQRPGAENSLGLVKFMFPNEYNVYLHDTPSDSLFARASRSFSHGCVRVERPAELAAYLLRDQPEWTPEKIDEAMRMQEERTVKLREPIPVYLGYWTARVTADGVLQFRKDVYGIDRRQTALLAERVERLRRSAAAALAAAGGPVGRPATANSTD